MRFHEVALGKPFHAALVFLTDSDPRHDQQHRHVDYYEFVLVIEGSGRHLLADASLPLATGDLLLVRPNDQHGFSPDNGTRLSWINIAFPTVGWHDFLAVTGADRNGEWAASPRPPHKRTSGEVAEALENSFRRALRRFNDAPTVMDLFRLWVDATEALQSRGSRSDADDTRRPSWLVKAVSEMRSQENLQMGLPRLLAVASVSPGHLVRSVRRYYGMTPTALITELRVRHASILLTTTSHPIGRISESCGFANQAYFSRCFRRETGLSPSDFRNQASRAILP